MKIMVVVIDEHDDRGENGLGVILEENRLSSFFL